MLSERLTRWLFSCAMDIYADKQVVMFYVSVATRLAGRIELTMTAIRRPGEYFTDFGG